MQNKTIWFSAKSSHDFGEDPQYGRFILTEKLAEPLAFLKSLAEQHSLTELRVCAGPDQWGPRNDDGESFEDEARLQGHELVVTTSDFWFVAQPKRDDGHVESHAISHADLQKVIDSDVEHHFFSDTSVEDLMETIRDCGELNLPEEV